MSYILSIESSCDDSYYYLKTKNEQSPFYCANAMFSSAESSRTDKPCYMDIL